MKALAWFKGALTLLLGASFGLVFLFPLLLMALLKVLFRPLSLQLTRIMIWLTLGYVGITSWIYRLIHKPEWRVTIDASIRPDQGCVLLCNHQSWPDVPLLILSLYNRVPFFTFFLKEELRWIPLIGWAAWALDYPFLKRHSPEALARNPALREEDARSTELACNKLKNRIPCLINFAEGTRFTTDKQRQMQSPYRYLLPPKAGALTYALLHLNSQIKVILDATIIYYQPEPTFWKFLCGTLGAVELNVCLLEKPSLAGINDKELGEIRARVKPWLDQRWQEKDEFILARTNSFTSR